jgi:hypothetical protein
MFSQYSWWDFVKFVLALAVPYYAYVLIKYYREDIREWISNRGHTDLTPATVAQQEEEDEPSPSRFMVNDYSDQPQPTASQHQPAQALSSSSKAQAEQPARFIDEEDLDEFELQGPDVDDQPEHFGVPLLIQTENLQEQSIQR